MLVGPGNLNVEVHEQGCAFRFDFAKVYWNSRLHTEHERLVSMFSEGDAICDVMAGVGPFAVPAGKKRVFVWANDLNPESYASLTDAIKRNKVCSRFLVALALPVNMVFSGHRFCPLLQFEWPRLHPHSHFLPASNNLLCPDLPQDEKVSKLHLHCISQSSYAIKDRRPTANILPLCHEPTCERSNLPPILR